MPTKIFHITDFPCDRLCISLDKRFREKLLVDKKLAAKIVNKSLSTIKRWQSGTCDRGKSMGLWRKGDQYIPLSDALKLIKHSKINTVELEKNIVAYKAVGAGNKFNSPILPLKEIPELFGLIVHIICDGSGLPNNTNYYRNYDPKLLDEFVDYTKKCFGDVELTRTTTSVIFPIAISYILSKLYNIKFGTFNARLPKRLFCLPENFVSIAIRAFIDDEGSIGHSGVRVYSANKNLINDLRLLIQNKYPLTKLSEIYMRKRRDSTEYSFGISSKSFKFYRDKIGFTNVHKKEDLEFYVKLKKREWNHRPRGLTKKMILDELSKGPASSKELAKKLEITPKLITYHTSGYDKKGKRIKGLEELDYVTRQRKSKEIIWVLNESKRSKTEKNQRC